jgi:site-specific recombinase XerD
MNPSWSGFGSCLADSITGFLGHQRALGKRFATEEAALRLLDRYLVEQEVGKIEQISSAVLEAFLISRPRTTARSYNHLVSVLGRLFRWLVAQQRLAHSPMNARPHRCTQQRAPFLFEPCEVERLLRLAAQLGDGPHSHQRGTTYRLIFALMYALGLRVGEAARLCRKDVDLDRQYLLIRQTKFAKTRIVPFGPHLAEALQRHLRECERRHGGLGPDDPVFSVSKSGRQPIYAHSISRTFQQLVPRLDLTVPAGVASPRLHCLRHSFAVATLLRWYRGGIDPNRRLIYLSTFLGHVNPTSTAVYLTITSDLLDQANEKFHRFSAPILREIHQ